ncbi:hypothetical protein [Corynebacterium nuruki]|uniref:hypothetical protein n=1 Tax=Corynebacterium nuruki TaxID=1032851 RepID=UPI000248548D|nr:hypothetical protein [Corynebacterium nuruki]
MSLTTPPIARGRRKAVLAAEVGFVIILVSAVLCLVNEDIALIVWGIGVCFASGCVLGLRRSVHREDLRPDDELDEYELQRRYRAQQGALKRAAILLFIVWIAFALLTLFRVPGPDSFDTLIHTLHACYCATSAAMLYVPFMVLRDIAGGMNRDLAMSGPDAVD